MPGPSRSDDGDGTSDVGLEIGALGALIRGSGEDADLLRHLANILGSALPDNTKVETRGGLLAPKQVCGVRVQIADTHFSIARTNQGLVSEKHKIVRGVRLFSREMPVDQWIRELAAEISRLAETNTAARSALERMIFGGS